MRTVTMRYAQAHLPRLVREAVGGEPFIIARAGTPLVQVSEVEPPSPKTRLGFLTGQVQVPDDFDTLGADEIQAMFEDRRIAGPEEEQEERTDPPDPS